MTEAERSYLYSGNAAFVEGLYELWLDKPDSVEPEWQKYFSQLQSTEARPVADIAHTPIRKAFAKAAKRSVVAAPAASVEDNGDRRTGVRRTSDKQVAVLQLINAYRFRGHRAANLDPLARHERLVIADLDLEFYDLVEEDLDTVFSTGSLFGVETASLRTILEIIRNTYTSTIGAEYMYLTSTDQKRWIQERLESNAGDPGLDDNTRRHILERLVAANALEQYLHTRYVGQKRFSLEGGDSLIPLLDELTLRASNTHKAKEIIIGMAHRGRLNVLVNILGKMPGDLFLEFEGHAEAGDGSGDVKYHKGFSVDIETANGPLHQVLAFNPSHLEVINPVVEGSVRARQERRRDKQRNEVLPVLLHGDAAFAGQGIVMETLNLSETRGYTTGGTIHIIINNQIGFTTSDPLDARSTLYCSDVAKIVQAPIFHVNGDDPEAVISITRLALDYRMTFHKDVVIDMVCYRRHGHSEADEPSATQPVMYQHIDNIRPVQEVYAEYLVKEGVVDADELQKVTDRYLAKLEANEPVSQPLVLGLQHQYLVDYRPYQHKHWTEPTDTTLSKETVRSLGEKLNVVPKDFNLHKAVARIMDNRSKMANGTTAIDWGFAECLAYASLVELGYPIRLSGQDSGRGTFFHRHAVVHDQITGDGWIPLQHISRNQAKFLVINSLLSEAAVLGFEMGYSTAEPNTLVIWEAQFGDFANNAQVIIDQFISSSESKWRRLCGLTLMLPHGFDGQGPEHSSARLERYLQLCAEDNMQVCVPTTPAQMFHLLRRQVLRPYRKPLIIMSPKSLLRHKLSTSAIADITESGYQNVIDDVDSIDPANVQRLILCTGKVYYDLLEARRQQNIETIAIARIEQLYPFPMKDVKALMKRYRKTIEIMWVQEEPRNQGAWRYMQSHRHLRACLKQRHRLKYSGRTYSASPAVGYLHRHLEQQRELVAEALRLDVIDVRTKNGIRNK